jgi:hypothetical protein
LAHEIPLLAVFCPVWRVRLQHLESFRNRETPRAPKRIFTPGLAVLWLATKRTVSRLTKQRQPRPAANPAADCRCGLERALTAPTVKSAPFTKPESRRSSRTPGWRVPLQAGARLQQQSADGPLVRRQWGSAPSVLTAMMRSDWRRSRKWAQDGTSVRGPESVAAPNTCLGGSPRASSRPRSPGRVLRFG